MAEVLNLSIDNSIQIENTNYTYYYGNKIYIVTLNYLYIFNPSLNIIEKRIQRTTPSGYTNVAMGTGVDDIIYCYASSGGRLYRFYYNITDDSYITDTSSRISFDNSSAIGYLSGNNDQNKNVLYYIGRSSQFGYPYMYNYNTNAETTVNYANLSSCFNQIVYYEGNYYILGTGGVNVYYGTNVSSNLLIYSGSGSSVTTLNSILPVKLRGCSAFVKNGEIYYYGGEYTDEEGLPANLTWSNNNNIYVYNIQNQSYRVLDFNITLNNKRNYACLYNDTYYTFTANGVIKLSFVEYNNTYKFANSDGSVVYAEITDLAPITSTLFGLNEVSNIVSYRFNTLAGEVIGSFEIESVEGKKLAGFSLSPSARPIFYLNTNSDYRLNESETFYASYIKYRPPATTFDINLYQNSAEVNRVDKGQFLVGVGTLSGALREECSMLTPSIVYQSSDVPTFNYVYIPIFNRYYYVTSLSSVSKNVWRMELNCDVLMTYKEQIFLLQGVIGRQEIDFNPLLVDNELPTQNNPIVEVIDIPSDAFNTQTSDAGHNYVITVIGA